jgi:hypothetical protein
MQTTAVVSNSMAYVSNVHLRVLLGVHHSRNGDTEVGDRAPEVYMIIVRKPSCKQVPSSRPRSRGHSITQGQTIILFSSFSSASLMADLGLGGREVRRETRGGFRTYGLSRHSPQPCWSGSWR